MKYIRARNIPNAWFEVCKTIYKDGIEYEVGRGSEETLTKKISVSLEITNPEERPLVDDKAPVSDLNKYAVENLFMKDNESYEYTYGSRFRQEYDQMERVIEKFKEEPNDRQNTMITRKCDDLEIENPPCLTVLDLEIVNEKLISYSYWRSWDAYTGLPANLGGLQLLIEYMAKEIGVESGKMFAFSKNLHLYERQFKFVEDMIADNPYESEYNLNNFESDYK